MLQKAWDEIEKFYTLPNVGGEVVRQFQDLKASQPIHTKNEGALRHYCAFFLPYDQKLGEIYLGYHKKADDWIPPGGHLEPGETPPQAAIREMQEELGIIITPNQLERFALSVKPINRPESGCVAHYDVWYLVHIPKQSFNYLKSEYHDAGWLKINDGLKKIRKNPDFASIISRLI